MAANKTFASALILGCELSDIIEYTFHDGDARLEAFVDKNTNKASIYVNGEFWKKWR